MGQPDGKTLLAVEIDVGRDGRRHDKGAVDVVTGNRPPAVGFGVMTTRFSPGMAAISGNSSTYSRIVNCKPE